MSPVPYVALCHPKPHMALLGGKLRVGDKRRELMHREAICTLEEATSPRETEPLRPSLSTYSPVASGWSGK
jgi:hypothetical protein